MKVSLWLWACALAPRVFSSPCPSANSPPSRSCPLGAPPDCFRSCWDWEHSLLGLFSQSVQTGVLALNQGNDRLFPSAHCHLQPAPRRALGTLWAALPTSGRGAQAEPGLPATPLCSHPPALGSTMAVQAVLFPPVSGDVPSPAAQGSCSDTQHWFQSWRHHWDSAPWTQARHLPLRSLWCHPPPRSANTRPKGRTRSPRDASPSCHKRA